MSQFWFNPSRPSDGLPDLVQLAPPQSEPGVDVPGYLPVEYDPVNDIITLHDGETIQWPPPSPPVLDWDSFQLATIAQYEQLLDLSTATFGVKATLQNWIAKMPINRPEALPLFVQSWNAVAGLVPAESGIDWAGVVAAAVEYHCPVFANLDPDTGLLPTGE